MTQNSAELPERIYEQAAARDETAREIFELVQKLTPSQTLDFMRFVFDIKRKSARRRCRVLARGRFYKHARRRSLTACRFRAWEWRLYTFERV